MIVPIVFQLALMAAGFGALRAAGVLRAATPRQFAQAGGLAYLVGAALTMQSCVLLLVIGLPFGLPMVAVVCIALASPLLRDLSRGRPRGHPSVLRRARRGREQLRAMSRPSPAAIVLIAFAGLAVIGLVTVNNSPVDQYDAWNLWARRAELMFDGGHLPLHVLSSTSGGDIHPDYPFVLPLLEALQLRAMGHLEISSAHTAVWLIAIAFVWTGVYLGSRVARPAVCAVLFSGALMLVISQLLGAYADVPMAMFLGLAVLALGIWIESRARPDLVIAMLLFAGADGIKNEGVVGTVAVIAAAWLVLCAHRRWTDARGLLVAGLVLVAFTVLPWHVWLAAHSLRSDIPFPGGLSPAFLAGRVGRVGPGLKGLYHQLTGVATITFFVPLAIAIVILRASRSQRTAIVWFYALAGIFYFLALVWAYWVNPLPIGFLIAGSAGRIIVALAFIAMVGVLHLGWPQVNSPPPPNRQAQDNSD